MSLGFHQCDNQDGAWVYRPEATVVAVSDFAEGTVIDTVAIVSESPCLACALYDALMTKRARIIAPNAAGVRVPQPAVVGDRIRLAFKNASLVGTRPVAAVQPGAPPLPDAARVESPLVVQSKPKPVLPKVGQTLSMFGMAVMAAPVKESAAAVAKPSTGPRPVEDYGDFSDAPANDKRGDVDEKMKRRANILRLVKNGE